ncbi:MAG: DUF3299 domain-containing protein [Granulosicoccaceae bacterium]
MKLGLLVSGVLTICVSLGFVLAQSPKAPVEKPAELAENLETPPTVADSAKVAVEPSAQAPAAPVISTVSVLDGGTTDAQPGTAALQDGFLPLIPEPSEDGYIHIEWDSLMPSNFGVAPPPALAAPSGPTDHSGSGPSDLPNYSSVELVEELIGKKISIPGFVVPLDMDGQAITKFLFVPYMGACIHVPPPPPNQLIYAEIEEGLVLEEQWIPLEIYGTLGAEYVETGLGAAGYTLKVDMVKAFEY